MNIFVVDLDPTIAAQSLCDKHVVKMILESAQMLSTAHRVLNGTKIIPKNSKKPLYKHPHPHVDAVLYKATHVNHSCNVWLRESQNNYFWLCEHFMALCAEYTKRYGKIHACQRNRALWDYLLLTPRKMQTLGITPFAQAMPDQYKNADPVKAYRDYYLGEKLQIARWKYSNIPNWVLENNQTLNIDKGNYANL